MNHNRKRREAEARERRRHEAALKNAVLVDRSALDLSHCGLGAPAFLERGYYLEVPFTCTSCGSDEVWTAAQQKWWYEVAKGSIYSGPKHCRTCRREARLEKGKAHPLQNPFRWFERIRDDLDAALVAAGWHGVMGVAQRRPSMLSYGRGDALVRFRWDCGVSHNTFLLERRDARDAAFQPLVEVECNTFEATHGVLERCYEAVLTSARRELGLGTNP
jgi:hypothetical protein